MDTIENKESGSYKIRPAGRHLLTIGRDLIQDNNAALIELIKNAFDADSPSINITFSMKPDQTFYKILIEDKGHGMSRDTIINKWMVPSTADKLTRKTSPNGRILQGRKGIGRYAAAILGNDLLLESVDQTGKKTTAYIEWKQFETAKFLEDVEILIETFDSNESPGTTLTITGNEDGLAEWNETKLKDLKFQIKKLMSPLNKELQANSSNTSDKFEIIIKEDHFVQYPEQLIEETIEPFPLVNMFDYRIFGKLNSNGNGTFYFQTQKSTTHNFDEEILFSIGKETGCGSLEFDISVFDREVESLDQLIARGIKHNPETFFSRQETRKLLDDYNGIGVFRNGFRIRPLGDADFDWLKLNKQRIQNPSQKIGSNQVIGHINIQSEENSNLIEKSARDGLKENKAFENLKNISSEIISLLELRRFDIRRKLGISRPAVKIEQELELLYSFKEFGDELVKNLKSKGLDDESTQMVSNLLLHKSKEITQAAENLQKMIAMYQGQATVGNIINLVLHESRMPLAAIKSNIKSFKKRHAKFIETQDENKLQEISPIADEISKNTEDFSRLFEKLDPLAYKKRDSVQTFNIYKELVSVISMFANEMSEKSIVYKIEGSQIVEFEGWAQDFRAIFINLIQNSIYWIHEKNSPKKEISIFIGEENNSLSFIDYKDTGPGIDKSIKDNNLIFEPQFTTKKEGMGLGLAIAGEAAQRNGLHLSIFAQDVGVYFRLDVANEA
ncbi:MULTISPECIES: ATP-binding protein [Acinetobacter]|uniref:histidine kinase n=1 Tax=Acinetobacter baumannii 21072 TaxID=1310697 RepID=A0A062IGT3_ACIBA|nr:MULTISPECIES: ATP-binding protein [Acinetobacter]KCY19000.1 histidine kinase-, DNA gyrase B-, and HSP90-like ATPase family protein [Acinetobacter baumannii 21072]MCW1513815.1 ATP-binding protein [Acinetobacter baumannii]MDA3361549.1 ATP-binding protein [Acinetobacter baumannii]MDC4536898.1 ATP-binding protein [Acinetobacter baumannii]MDH2562856.1 ATP-binding protein [Acinetobacter baumannii]